MVVCFSTEEKIIPLFSGHNSCCWEVNSVQMLFFEDTLFYHFGFFYFEVLLKCVWVCFLIFILLQIFSVLVYLCCYNKYDINWVAYNQHLHLFTVASHDRKGKGIFSQIFLRRAQILLMKALYSWLNHLLVVIVLRLYSLRF